MNLKKIGQITQRPPLYEKGNCEMWNDEHISKILLETHLSQDSDLASRRKPAIEKTVGWIFDRLGKENAKILDLGCGPGLYCEMFAKAGHDITGVDLSKRSIDYAKKSAQEKDLDIEYINKNYLELDLSEKFDLVMMIFCDLDVLNPGERDVLLEKVYSVLKPGGMFVFDTMNDNTPTVMNPGEKSWEAAGSGGFWRAEPYLALTESFHYEDEKVILSQTIIYSEPEDYRIYRFWTHYYNSGDLKQILEGRGFSDVTCYENVLSIEDFYCAETVDFYTAIK
ncbi:class I SAM-dependent methyltransferase [Methanolacinia paynteri]|uniref:class I SAM-dependent methyltransferase n=1 Tax=Methanolacinia paynteri TaxID=230356 RepID=UPI00064E1572|nr:class I SAM-dependent methyltransferase [Methanolacinia paynteri]